VTVVPKLADKVVASWDRWGTPDPRNAAYSSLGGLTLSQWAWQFLRRNPDYRTYWADRVGIRDGVVVKFDQSDLVRRFSLWAPVAPSVDTHEAPPFVAQVTPMIGVSALLKRIGLEGIPEPEHIQLKANQVAVVFDLGRGLGDQISLTTEHLKFLQRQLANAGQVTIIEPREREQWAAYLRLIDGEDAGLTDNEIRQLLFPAAESRERQRVTLRNYRKRAHHMRDVGYKQIGCVASK
jgi:Proteobacterial transcriptional regulator-like domain